MYVLVQDWMFTIKLKLTPDKMEFMLIGNKCHREKNASIGYLLRSLVIPLPNPLIHRILG